MGRNRSLDEFVEATASSHEGGEPLEATYRFDGDDGAPCAKCGEASRLRWRSEVGWVCASCKRW